MARAKHAAVDTEEAGSAAAEGAVAATESIFQYRFEPQIEMQSKCKQSYKLPQKWHLQAIRARWPGEIPGCVRSLLPI
jgi:hypothetical protein